MTDKLTPFQQNALAYDRHISLTANAGSGKTTVLAKRYVGILENEHISINNIVAITFTEKAAGELYSKIAAEIERRIELAPVSKKRKLENIRRNLVSAKISTIHSFCIDILKDYAPEAGIDTNFSPIDSRISEELLQQSMDEIISSALSRGDEDVKYLIRLFGSRTQLTKNIKYLFDKRKSSEYLIENLYDNDVLEISDWFNRKFQECLSQYFSEIINDLSGSLSNVNSLAETQNESPVKSSINELLSELNKNQSIQSKLISLIKIKDIILTGKGTVRIQGYLTKASYESNKDIINSVEKLFNEISHLEISDNDEFNFLLAEFGKKVSQFYRYVRDRYYLKKQQRSFLDFEDLLIFAQKLTEKQSIRDDLSQKYKYIMIDEYQDTNEIQYRIFMPILNNLNTGNLFIVGDEKQSIYRFREADVELFVKTKNQIMGADNKSGIMELPHSFRLTPNIALFTNKIFGKLFDNSRENYSEVNYSKLICAYRGEEKGKIDFLISDGIEINEGELVARKIITLITDPAFNYQFNDFTVLCTKRKHFGELEEVFSKYRIPFNILGGKGFYQQQLVLDIFSYLSFLINPYNDLALASVLRSPFYGLSDTELTEISLFEGDSLYEKLLKSNKFPEICRNFDEHLKLSKNLKTNELIRKFTNDTGYWTYIAAKSNGSQEIANLKKIIQRAIEEDEKGFSSLYDFALYLKNAISSVEDEGQASTDLVADAVNIMTVHQSKGLEFKVVVLYKTNQRGFNEKLKSKELAVDKDFGILSKLPEGNNFFEEYKQAPIIGIYNYLQMKKSVAELKRLLYVAVTRAEKHLIVSAEINNRIWENSFADMIFNSLNIDFINPQYEISGDLEFMKLDGDKYSVISDSIKTKINVTKYLDPKQIDNWTEQSAKLNEYELFLDTDTAEEKNEIISASKISLFLNCPRKYELTYEFGYGELLKHFWKEEEPEFALKEDPEIVPGNIIGSLLHACLERNTPPEKIEEEMNSVLRSENIRFILDESEKNALITESKKILKSFYSSKFYLLLNSYPEFYNEIEFYKREYDYFLYGIIDKMIIDGKRIIIVDYKSDNISNKNKNEKIDAYTNQLMFYAFIAASKYPKIEEFDLNICFLRNLKYSYNKKVPRETVISFGTVIKSCVKKIRNKEFFEERNGCKNMKYYELPEN